jgi:hypothetical protein
MGYGLKYRLYPTLLNQYASFLKNTSAEAKAELLQQINRTKVYSPEIMVKFKKGQKFEDILLKNIAHDLDTALVAEAQALLPSTRVTQHKVSFNYEVVHFYGFADLIGEQRVIDIKTTSHFKKDRHLDNFQNLYLYGLKDQGFKQMEYLSFDGQKIYLETYKYEEIDFESLFIKMKSFTHFLEENRNRITDPKIFVKIENDLFS